jgi:hypothetical protein
MEEHLKEKTPFSKKHFRVEDESHINTCRPPFWLVPWP